MSEESRKERWHISRIGFVNFWLYDDDVFSFADGKLLLRGQNGSGKSITTQSFIPFILDGDRTPSRLDPFGSSDRRMEYYFLGDGEKEEATGYLYLEFQKGNRYRTIGIGQQAQRGKPMGFWGFVLLDGRRIGYDLFLYREVGNTKIACTKQELKKLLGETNPFTEAQREYMALVNKYIFGFPRLEQYEQFIRLLIKVRAPKLSKEFKPTKVYEILNESLQTLSDEDLRAMVDAMEKMDEIQDRLDGLKRARKDLQAIGNEYTKYNQYMLAQKAAAYLEEKSRVDDERTGLEASEAAYEENKTMAEQGKQRLQVLSEECLLLEKERDVIGLTDLEEAANALKQCRNRQEEAAAGMEACARSMEQHRDTIRDHEGQIRRIRQQIDAYQVEVEQLIRELDAAQEVIRFSGHHKVEELWTCGQMDEEARTVRQELEQLRKGVEQALAQLKGLREARQRWDSAAESCSILSAQADQAYAQVQDAQQVEDGARDALTEAFYQLETKNQIFRFSQKELEQLSGYIQQYQDLSDYGPVDRLLQAVRSRGSRVLLEQKTDKMVQLEQQKTQLLACRKELEELEAARELAPVRRTMAVRTREALSRQQIPFLPFYEAVDFARDVTEEERALLECQLEDTGLLDALIVPEDAYGPAVKVLGELADRLIRVTASGDEPCGKLRVVTQDAALRAAAEQILSGIGTEDSAQIVLRPDGYFRHGAVEGYSRPEREACYIGETVRREKREEQIRKKREEVECLLQQTTATEEEIALLEKQISVLEAEYRASPTFDDLNQAISMKERTVWEWDKCRQEWEQKQQETERLEAETKRWEQDVIRCCRNLPYERSVAAYEEVAETLTAYQEQFRGLQTASVQLQGQQELELFQNQMIEKEEDAIDREEVQHRRIQREWREQQVQIEKLEGFLNAPENKEKAERLVRIRGLLDEKTQEMQTLRTRQAVLEHEILRLEPEIMARRQELARKTEREARLGLYFEEELGLELVFGRETMTLPEAAQQAKRLLRDNERNKSVADVVSGLDRVFHAYSGGLAGYGTYMEECFPDDADDAFILRKRYRIVSYVQGKKLYFQEFLQIIHEKIEETELLIRQKDRELFENILSDTLSRKLNARITESRKWIQDMSALMRKMDTSMSLTFSLDWKARSAEGEGELDTAELEKLLNRDRALLTAEDVEKVSAHFRSKIYASKQTAEENKETVNYFDLVRNALDYREWFEFKMYYYRNDGNRRELTNGAFNRFSGGEKAMAMYVPLFAAVNAQYKKAERDDLPRIIALDEAFAGVDDKNISSMFELVRKFDFDYIMNSQVLWGCYATVPMLRIAELLRPANSQVVTVIYYLWNGKQKIIEEQ